MKNESALEVLNANAFTLVEQVHFTARQGQYSAIPSQLNQEVRTWLTERFPQGLFSHQGAALNAFLLAEDVGLMTPTASGKTAVFQAAAAHQVKSQPGSKILALFPLVALTKDQERSWRQLEANTGVRVGVIHGGIGMAKREAILADSDVILATPDVIHAWFMSNLSAPAIRAFREQLALLILDEAHVYDGVFGANMVVFLARLRACGGSFQTICASATLGDPDGFLTQLLGRRPMVIDQSVNGARTASKTLIAARYDHDDKSGLVKLIQDLGNAHNGQTLVFVDNRVDADFIAQLLDGGAKTEPEWVAYRAGYEDADRDLIQASLTQGKLRGVVATSALEAGVDIGSVELVVMLGRPAKMRSFWQRFGRLRNEVEGCAILLDAEWPENADAFQAWLQSPVEPNHLYLENQKLQIFGATCLNHEAAAIGQGYNEVAFAHLPVGFAEARRIAAHPEECFDEGLQILLSQAASDVPQRAFTLRSFERRFSVRDSESNMGGLGHLSVSQVFQEAFPGAIYRYMNRAYRVIRVNHADHQVLVRRINPKTMSRTFPTRLLSAYTEFSNLSTAWATSSLLIADTAINLREQIIGYTEKRGRANDNRVYGTTHTGRALMRTIPTTGVLIVGPSLSESAVETLAATFCDLEGVHIGDLCTARTRWNVGSQHPAVPSGVIQGWTIADRTPGSLRLSSKLIERWSETVSLALATTSDDKLGMELAALRDASEGLAPQAARTVQQDQPSDLVAIVAPQSKALYIDQGFEREVVIDEYLYHPTFGWCYRFQEGGLTHFQKACHIHRIPGTSEMLWYDPIQLRVTSRMAA
jgi:DEAD/DEAH box helicase domain-containing protein